MKVEVRDKVLHFLPESHNELVTAEWIYNEYKRSYDQLVVLGYDGWMLVAKPEYPPVREVDDAFDRPTERLRPGQL